MASWLIPQREVDTVIRRKQTWPAGLAVLALAATLMAAGTMQVAQANSCAASCRAAHNQCRISTKGSPTCDAQLQTCLQGCLSRR